MSTRTSKHVEKYHTIDRLIWNNNIRTQSPMAANFHKATKTFVALCLYKSQAKHKKAYAMASDLYKNAKKYHLPKYLVDAADYLFMYHTIFDFNRKKAVKYSKTKEEAIKDYNWENKALSARSNVLLSERSSHSKKNTIIELTNAWNLLNPNIGEIKSWEYHRNSFFIGCRLYSKLKDYYALLQTTNRAIDYLKSFPLRSNSTLDVFYKYKITCLLSLDSLDTILVALSEYSKNSKTGSNSWYYYQYLNNRILVYQGAYEKSTSNIYLVVNKSTFKNIPVDNVTAWLILAAYQEIIGYLYSHSIGTAKRKQSKYFDLIEENMLTDIEDHIQYKILQLIHDIIRNDWKAIENKSFALQKFTQRNKLHKTHRRSDIFLKMMCLIPEQNYHSVAIDRHTRHFHTRLKKTKAIKNIIDSPEIIPYEHLWELIMENLKRKHHKR